MVSLNFVDLTLQGINSAGTEVSVAVGVTVGTVVCVAVGEKVCVAGGVGEAAGVGAAQLVLRKIEASKSRSTANERVFMSTS